MSPVRRSILTLSALAGVAAACAPAQKAAPPAAAPTAAAPVARASTAQAPPARPECTYFVRRLSAYGRGAVRPQIAATPDAFAIAWEETTDHRSIRVATYTLDSQPLGSSNEIADVARAAAEPRVAANPDGDGFALFWSASTGDGSSAIDMRRIDCAGRPKSDAVPIVSAPGARALDATPVDGGYAVAWWNWSGTPHQLAVTFVDKNGRPVGKALPITRAPTPDPTVDISPGAALGRQSPTVLAWDETIDGVDHVIVGDLGRDRLEGRTDLGPGVTPRMGAGILVFERPADISIWSAPLSGGAPPVRLADGHVPAAAPRPRGVTALCYLRDPNPTDDKHVDELICGDLVDGKLVDSTRLAVEPRGIFALHVAASGGRIGVTWQSQSEDDTGDLVRLGQLPRSRRSRESSRVKSSGSAAESCTRFFVTG